MADFGNQLMRGATAADTGMDVELRARFRHPSLWATKSDNVASHVRSCPGCSAASRRISGYGLGTA